MSELGEFQHAAAELTHLPLRVLPIDAEIIEAGAKLSQQLGLLTNDALIVALIRYHGLQHLVTNDDDFDGITGVTVWKPR